MHSPIRRRSQPHHASFPRLDQALTDSVQPPTTPEASTPPSPPSSGDSVCRFLPPRHRSATIFCLPRRSRRPRVEETQTVFLPWKARRIHASGHARPNRRKVRSWTDALLRPRVRSERSRSRTVDKHAVQHLLSAVGFMAAASVRVRRRRRLEREPNGMPSSLSAWRFLPQRLDSGGRCLRLSLSSPTVASKWPSVTNWIRLRLSRAAGKMRHAGGSTARGDLTPRRQRSTRHNPTVSSGSCPSRPPFLPTSRPPTLISLVSGFSPASLSLSPLAPPSPQLNVSARCRFRQPRPLSAHVPLASVAVQCATMLAKAWKNAAS